MPLHGRNWKPKPSVKKEEPEIDLPEEWNEALNEANEKDVEELAGTELLRERFFHELLHIFEVNRTHSTFFSLKES